MSGIRQEPLELSPQFCRFYCFTLPNNEQLPAQSPQFSLLTLIPFYILIQLISPERFMRVGPLRSSAALMAVPKAPMDENNLLVFPEDDIGIPGQIVSAGSKSITHPMDHRPDRYFGQSIIAPNAAHNLASFIRRKNVGHLSTCVNSK
jgi:hypothetical protein